MIKDNIFAPVSVKRYDFSSKATLIEGGRNGQSSQYGTKYGEVYLR